MTDAIELSEIELRVIKHYQIYVSERAWLAFPKYGRGKLLKSLPLNLKVAQPSPRLRTRRCLSLEFETAAKLEAIAINNNLRNPWNLNSTGTRYGSGRLGIAIEAIGQSLASQGGLR